MNFRLVSIFLASFFVTSILSANEASQSTETAESRLKKLSANRKLVWSDEFNYTGLPDQKKWNYEVGFIRNNEEQYYTKARKENVRVENGSLIIEGRKEKYRNAKYNPFSDKWQVKDEFAKYTSGSINTRGKASWKYGYIEIRAKIPTGQGSWPAIWMMGIEKWWPACGEIDIMENIGKEPDIIHATVHWKSLATGKHKMSGGWVKAPKVYEGFHVYSVDWNKDRIIFYIDGKKYFSYTITDDAGGAGENNAFRKPFYLLLNLALGGNWPGKLNPQILPLKYYIDYVRIYQ